MPAKNQVVRTHPVLSPRPPKAPPYESGQDEYRPPATIVIPDPAPTNTGPKQTAPTSDKATGGAKRKPKAKAKAKAKITAPTQAHKAR